MSLCLISLQFHVRHCLDLKLSFTFPKMLHLRHSGSWQLRHLPRDFVFLNDERDTMRTHALGLSLLLRRSNYTSGAFRTMASVPYRLFLKGIPHYDKESIALWDFQLKLGFMGLNKRLGKASRPTFFRIQPRR